MAQIDFKQHPFQIGEWQVDPRLNRVTRGEETVTLVPKMMTTLVFLAENAGDMVTRDQLFSYVWKDQFVGDNAVYHQIAQLRKLFKDSTSNPRYIETIAKKGYRLIAHVAAIEETKLQSQVPTKGQPLPPILAPEQTQNSQPLTSNIKFKVIVTTLAIILLFGGYQLFEIFNQSHKPELRVTRKIDSIAVLPFKALGNSQQQQYFAEGLAETMLHQLSQLKNLRVSARNSSFEFQQSNQDFQAIGNKLGVASILTGSIQTSAEQKRIIIQLISVQDGSHLWSKTFDYTDQNIFAIHDAIAQSVATALRLELNQTTLPIQPTTNKVAYDNYLRGRYHFNRPSAKSLDRAIAYFQDAILQDPTFVLAYVGLSDSYLLMQQYGGSKQTESIELATQAIDQALAINPLLGEVHSSLASLKFSLGDLTAAETSFQKAIELSPNYADNYHGYGALLNHQGRIEEAYQMTKKAVVLDPLSIMSNYNLAWITYELGRFAEADAQLQHAFELMPDGPTKYLQQHWTDGVNFDYLQDFINWFHLNRHKLEEVPANFPSFALIGHMWLIMDDSSTARTWIEMAETLAPREYFTYYSLAVLSMMEQQNNSVRHYFQLMQSKAPSNKLSMFYYGIAEIWMENYSVAASLLIEAFPEFEHLSAVTIDQNNSQALVRYAKTLQETGNKGGASKLLVKLREYFQRNPINHQLVVDISDVETLAMLGKSTEAINLLKQAIDQGWMPNYYKMEVNLERNSMLSNLKGHSEFIQLTTKVSQRQQQLQAMAKR